LTLSAFLIAGAALIGGLATLQAQSGLGAIDDRAFLQRTAARSQWKYKAGVIAARQAAREEVKKFGRLTAEYYRQVEAEVSHLSAQIQMNLSPHLNLLEENTLSHFSSLQQATLDREYVSAIADAFNEDIQDFHFQEEKAGELEVRELASRLAVKAKEFLKEADKLLANEPKPCLK
jgi:hypothetical protein